MLSRSRLHGSVVPVSLVIALAALAACGKGSGVGQSTPTASDSPTPISSPTSSPTNESRLTYADAQFGFRIKYPSDFATLVHTEATLRESNDGFLRVVAFSERQFEGKEAPGVVNIRVYEKGSTDAIDDWVREHSASKSEEGRRIYFKETTNLKSVTVAGRQGVSFDWDASESGIAHTRAFFYKAYVIAILWSATASYESKIVPVFEQIVSSWQDG